MATYVAYSQGGPWVAMARAHLGRMVLQLGAATPVPNATRSKLDDMFNWLNDPTRTGYYSYQYGTKVDHNSFEMLIDNMRLYFDDERTAFEFKLRWG